jgi:hypothetical protein
MSIARTVLTRTVRVRISTVRDILDLELTFSQAREARKALDNAITAAVLKARAEERVKARKCRRCGARAIATGRSRSRCDRCCDYAANWAKGLAPEPKRAAHCGFCGQPGHYQKTCKAKRDPGPA